MHISPSTFLRKQKTENANIKKKKKKGKNGIHFDLNKS